MASFKDRCNNLNEPRKAIKATDLEIGKVYKVVAIKKTNSKYGSLLMQLEEVDFWLPARYSKHISQADIDAVNNGTEPLSIMVSNHTEIYGKLSANVLLI